MGKLVGDDLGKEQHHTQRSDPELYAEILFGGLQTVVFAAKITKAAVSR
jgi:hypothetical protein